MIYLDNAATTACLPEVVDAMLPFFRETFANASSIDHLPGTLARRAVDTAREHVAALVNGKPEDVIFTSGSTEANNLALSINLPLITSPVEHPSILDSYRARKRADDRLVQVNSNGTVDVEDLRNQLRDGGPKLVAIIVTNNETGAEQDLSSIQTTLADVNGFLHLDATQAVLTRRIMARESSNSNSVAISAHKIYGPKGVGALIAAPKLRKLLRPTMFGGGHERGARSGTLNVPGIVGFGVAAKLLLQHGEQRRLRFEALRSAFLATIRSLLNESISLTIPERQSSPHILSLRICGVNARALLGTMHRTVAFSLGAACATNKSEPSHVLVALGYSKQRISETFRVSFSLDQTENDMAEAATLISRSAKRLRTYSVSA